MPDGRRVGFTFTPTLEQVGGATIYRPAWTADAGVNYQIRTAASVLERVDGSFYELGTGVPYNPASGRFQGFDYTLVAADGTQYGYDVYDGLREIIGAAGQTIHISEQQRRGGIGRAR